MKIENKLVETRRTDEVKVGQTRATKDMELIVLIIKAPLAIGNGAEDVYSAVILQDKEFRFELDNEYGAETSATSLDLYPVLIDSTITLKEFYKYLLTFPRKCALVVIHKRGGDNMFGRIRKPKQTHLER